jgi:hypothetical protein
MWILPMALVNNKLLLLNLFQSVQVQNRFMYLASYLFQDMLSFGSYSIFLYKFIITICLIEVIYSFLYFIWVIL